MCDQSTTSGDPPIAARPAARAAAFASALAFALSAATSPFVVLPLFAGIITWEYCPDLRHFLWWAGISVFFSTGLPFLYIAYGMLSGQITDLHVMKREQRSGPFLLSLISSAAGTAVLHLVGAPMPLVVLGVAIVANGVVFALITIRWKISMHLSVYAASVVAASALLDPGWLILLALLPAIVWARARRTRHSVMQGIAAAMVSSAVTFAVLALFGYS